MARWTETLNDMKKISRISQELPIVGIVRIVLDNNETIEGVIRSSNSGNNAGQGKWKYYGEVEIETTNHQLRMIDYLDKVCY